MWSSMMSTAVVVGENDHDSGFSDRRDWRSDAYQFSPAPKSRILFIGADHFLGGLGTLDGSRERVAAVSALVWGYLRGALYPEDPAWTNASIATPALAGRPNPSRYSNPNRAMSSQVPSVC
jgi:hypothetical protein